MSPDGKEKSKSHTLTADYCNRVVEIDGEAQLSAPRSSYIIVASSKMMMKSEQTTLYPTVDLSPTTGTKQDKTVEHLKRVDVDRELWERRIPYCRLNHDEIWEGRQRTTE